MECEAKLFHLSSIVSSDWIQSNIPHARGIYNYALNFHELHLINSTYLKYVP